MKRNNPKRGGRENVQVFTDDIMAIRKIRISRKITREDAGKTLGISAKTIERIENGCRNISDERLKQLIRRYRYTTIVDKSPEFLKYLRTNPLNEEALYIQKELLRRIKRTTVIGWQWNCSKKNQS
jgi:transcriptional regulator with XRE-family HTH domain